jgi:molybdate transport system ATP-binding protein
VSELVARFEKRFSRDTAVRVELKMKAPGFSVTVLFGPSGAGKTTVLRCLAGLERPETGEIRLGGEVWFDAREGVNLRPQERGIGYLFQEYALFPHLTVGANIGYGLSGVSPDERRRIVGESLDRYGLTGLQDRYPREISGGQQQRVALARVLARRPRLLLLDEPLSALDEVLRQELRWELQRVLEDSGIPVLLVTHDRIEAIALADEVVVMEGGGVLQTGPVQEVFTRPSDLSVARIVGVETVVPARVLRIEDGLATMDVAGVSLVAVTPEHLEKEAHVCIRAEDVLLQRNVTGTVSARNQLRARVTAVTPEGPLVRVGLDCGFFLTALVTRPACEELALKTGEWVFALIKAPSVHLVPRGTRD